MKKLTVVLGISGGIAAFKVIDLAKLLMQKGIKVEAILTESAIHLLEVGELEKVIGKKAHRHLFPKNFDYHQVLEKRRVDHIDLADEADLMVLVPATAHLVAKLVAGLADDFLTTTVLATKSPVVVCPTMNVNMWQHPAVQKNLTTLAQLGYQVIKPVAGPLACGYDGLGRLPEIKDLASEIMTRLKQGTALSGKKILVTAGATREPIDSVRFITNLSSGKMGAAIASAAERKGATVKLLMAQKDFVTSGDLLAQVKKHAPQNDIIFHTAAVGDFQPERKRPGKLSSTKAAMIRLKPVPKILPRIKKINPRILVIGFKAEFGIKNPRLQKGVDATVVNDISRPDIGFAAYQNEVSLVLPGKKPLTIKKAPKALIAEKLLDELSRHYHW